MRSAINPHIRLPELMCCGQCIGEYKYNGVDSDKNCTCVKDCKDYVGLMKRTKIGPHYSRVLPMEIIIED